MRTNVLCGTLQRVGFEYQPEDPCSATKKYGFSKEDLQGMSDEKFMNAMVKLDQRLPKLSRVRKEASEKYPFDNSEFFQHQHGFPEDRLLEMADSEFNEALRQEKKQLFLTELNDRTYRLMGHSQWMGKGFERNREDLMAPMRFKNDRFWEVADPDPDIQEAFRDLKEASDEANRWASQTPAQRCAIFMNWLGRMEKVIKEGQQFKSDALTGRFAWLPSEKWDDEERHQFARLVADYPELKKKLLSVKQKNEKAWEKAGQSPYPWKATALVVAAAVAFRYLWY